MAFHVFSPAHAVEQPRMSLTGWTSSLKFAKSHIAIFFSVHTSKESKTIAQVEELSFPVTSLSSSGNCSQLVRSCDNSLARSDVSVGLAPPFEAGKQQCPIGGSIAHRLNLIGSSFTRIIKPISSSYRFDVSNLAIEYFRQAFFSVCVDHANNAPSQTDNLVNVTISKGPFQRKSATIANLNHCPANLK